MRLPLLAWPAALIGAAVVSPDIPSPAGLPAIRLEQLLLAGLLPALAVMARRDRTLLRPHLLVDAPFAALAAATAVTLALAPVLDDRVTRSPRDLFEIARVAEYWLLLRVGIAGAGRDGAIRLAALTLAVAAAGQVAFALVQYLHPGDFNRVVSDIWTEENNLLALERRGRVIGTIGNANYFGIFAGLALMVGLGALAVGSPRPAILRGATASVLAATFITVLAQSRTLAGSVAIGLCFFALVAAWRGVAVSRFVRPVITLGLTGIAAVAFMLAVPPRYGGIAERFDIRTIADDPALTSRLSRWKSLFAGNPDSAPAAACAASTAAELSPVPGHEPRLVADAGSPATERDDRRKADIRLLFDALWDYYCEVGAWPTSPELANALVPRFLSAVPHDPSTRRPYRSFVHPGGFLIGADLERVDDLDGPIFALGSVPNFLANPSFEDGGSRPEDWGIAGPATLEYSRAPAPFGERSVALRLRPGRISGAIASLRQNVPAAYYGGTDYTFAAWVRSQDDTGQSLQLYVITITDTGTPIEAFASANFEITAGTGWQRLVVPIHIPSNPPLLELRLFVIAPYATGPASVALDAMSLTLGTFPPTFAFVRDVRPTVVSAADSLRFADSPLIGVGPRKEFEATGFDNEYAAFLDRYGLLGTAAYLAVWAGSLVALVRSTGRHDGDQKAIALALVGFTVSLLVFNVAAGVYYDFQLMGMYWPLVGLAIRKSTRA